MTILRLLLLCLSLFGYVLFLYKQCRIEASFTPAITASFILLTVYLAGILGILAWSVYLLVAIGLGLLVWMLVTKKPTEWKKLFLSPALIALTVFGIYLFFRFQNRVLYSYDDFSHWGVMVQTMLRTNSFPTAANSFISFQSYPPGSACFIYFVSRVLGAKEGFFLFAHAMLTLSYLVPLFTFFNKHRWYDLLLPLVGCVLIYTNVLDPNCMGVDVLLAATGLAGVVMIYRYRASLARRVYLLLPLLCVPLLIKNSGVFFSVVSCCAFLYFLADQKKGTQRARWIAAGVSILVPVTLLLLWRHHVAISFEDGLGTKHAMSLENFLAHWANNKGHALEMLQKILLWIVNPQMNKTIYLLGGLIALAGVEAALHRDKQANARNIEFLAVLLLVTFLYEVGVALMYLFSMPLAEFNYQNGADYYRYNSTIVDFLIGIALLWCGKKLKDLTETASQKSKPYRWVLRVGLLALLLVCLIPGTQIQTLAPAFRTELETQVEHIHAVLDEEKIGSGGSYYLKTYPDDQDLGAHMFSYLLFSGNLESTSEPVDSSEIPEIVSFYDAYLYWNKEDFKVYTAESFSE